MCLARQYSCPHHVCRESAEEEGLAGPCRAALAQGLQTANGDCPHQHLQGYSPYRTSLKQPTACHPQLDSRYAYSNRMIPTWGYKALFALHMRFLLLQTHIIPWHVVKPAAQRCIADPQFLGCKLVCNDTQAGHFITFLAVRIQCTAGKGRALCS